jgi:drug/metabolite transporter (DMT)-like permease
MPVPTALLELLAIGTLATLAQIIMTRGYAYAPAARIGPFGYSMVLFAALIGWLVWDERLDAYAAVGAALVCLSGMLALRRAVSAPV